MRAYDIYVRLVNGYTEDGYSEFGEPCDSYFADNSEEAESIYIDQMVDAFYSDICTDTDEIHNDFGNPADYEIGGKQYQVIAKEVNPVRLEDRELAFCLRNSKGWDKDMCQELCNRAGLDENLESMDDECIKVVVEKAANILSVEIY